MLNGWSFFDIKRRNITDILKENKRNDEITKKREQVKRNKARKEIKYKAGEKVLRKIFA